MHHQKVDATSSDKAMDGMAGSTTVPARARSRPSPSRAKTWVVALACRKAKELGYPHEVWTTRLLARMPASMDRLRGIRA